MNAQDKARTGHDFFDSWLIYSWFLGQSTSCHDRSRTPTFLIISYFCERSSFDEKGECSSEYPDRRQLANRFVRSFVMPSWSVIGCARTWSKRDTYVLTNSASCTILEDWKIQIFQSSKIMHEADWQKKERVKTRSEITQHSLRQRKSNRDSLFDSQCPLHLRSGHPWAYLTVFIVISPFSSLTIRKSGLLLLKFVDW